MVANSIPTRKAMGRRDTRGEGILLLVELIVVYLFMNGAKIR
jgi:hypothetical protein